MLAMGPHVEKDDLKKWVAVKTSPGWGAIQIFPGNPMSYSVDKQFPREVAVRVREWMRVVVHGCYMAYCNNGANSEARALQYIQECLEWTTKMGFNTFLVHMGATKGKDPKDVVAGIQKFGKWVDSQQFECRLVIENVAAAYPANNSELVLDAIVGTSPRMGLCIDTCHAFAAGWETDEITRRIEKYKPEVIHLNAPASYIERGSGRDRHGWWYEGRHLPLLNGVMGVLKTYDPTIILEGASEPGESSKEDVFVRGLFNQQEGSKL